MPTAPRAVRQCIAGGPLPTAPRQWCSVLQEVHCPLHPGSEAVYCRRSAAQWPQAVGQRIARGPLPATPRQWGSALMEVYCPLPTAPRQCGSALQEVHCPLPPGCGAVYSRMSTAHCPQAVRQCVAGGPLPTAPRL